MVAWFCTQRTEGEQMEDDELDEADWQCTHRTCLRDALEQPRRRQYETAPLPASPEHEQRIREHEQRVARELTQPGANRQ